MITLGFQTASGMVLCLVCILLQVRILWLSSFIKEEILEALESSELLSSSLDSEQGLPEYYQTYSGKRAVTQAFLVFFLTILVYMIVISLSQF
mmetsp:Transcript_33663/g.51980  ORF Transcript_33663/g.51980 Transcript_33663/m.51980 type:complete len:93 (-) Transcript_33663:1397-1675(-)